MGARDGRLNVLEMCGVTEINIVRNEGKLDALKSIVGNIIMLWAYRECRRGMKNNSSILCGRYLAKEICTY